MNLRQICLSEDLLPQVLKYQALVKKVHPSGSAARRLPNDVDYY